MNFNKIERIFIVAFALLNVFLFVSYVNRQDIQHVTSETRQVDILAEMADADITVAKELKKEIVKQDVYSQQANANTLLEDEAIADGQRGTLDKDGKLYRSLVSAPLKLSGTPTTEFSKEDLTKLTELLVDEDVLFNDNYRYSHFDLEKSQFVFYQVVDDLPVADGTSEIVLNVNAEGHVFSYEQSYAGPMEPQGNKLDVIDAQEAVETLFIHNEIPDHAHVGMPKLTYRRNLHLADLSIYSPVWVVNVKTKNDEPLTLRVDAVSGSVLRDVTVTQEEPAA